jgi:branched-subunit amino acid transport protein
MYLTGKITVSENFSKALRFVPPTVLMGLIFPAIFNVESNSNLAIILNPKLFAALIASLTEYKYKNISLSILIGMLSLYLFQYLIS